MLAALSSSALKANDAGPTVVATQATTLEALVAETLANNPELQFYQAELAAARAGRKSAGRLANPELSGSIGQKTIRGGDLSAEGIVWSASLMQPFEWPGRLGLRKAIANRDVELAELGLARFKTTLAARVRLLGYGLSAAQEKAEAARQIADRFQSLREVLVQRDPAGLTPLLEMRSIEATELTARAHASDAELAASAALLELNQLRGASAHAPVSAGRTSLIFHSLPGTDVLLTAARTNNFELRVRAVELAQHGFRVDLAKNERFPGISIGPQISQERAGDREQIVGLGVSFPLPLWNRNAANVESAKARQTQAEASLLVTQRELERQILQAAQTYQVKRRQMQDWKPDAVKHFKEAADLADRHYRLGAVPLSTYLELQQQYLEAVETLLNAKRDALEMAQQIEMLTGVPLPLTIAEENQ